jgi:phosphoribosylformylglycinamidine synthase
VFKIEATTTRRSSGRVRARPPASAGSCATCSRWARPVASLDSLRFSPLDRCTSTCCAAVDGIGGYGNPVGVATVGGDDLPSAIAATSWSTRSISAWSADRVFLAKAAGIGNP